MACHLDTGSRVAEVAEVSVVDGVVRVHRVVAAVDCGLCVNPDIGEAQIEGGIIFGLSAALKGEITVERGRIRERSFDDYPMLRIDETPAVEVHFVQSSAPPEGSESQECRRSRRQSRTRSLPRPVSGFVSCPSAR